MSNNIQKIKIVKNINEAYFLFLRKVALMKNEKLFDTFHGYDDDKDRLGVKFSNWLFMDEGIFVPYKIFIEVLDKLEHKKIIKKVDEINLIDEYDYPIGQDKNGNPSQTVEEYIILQNHKYPDVPLDEVASFIYFEIKKIDNDNKIIKKEINYYIELGFSDDNYKKNKFKINFDKDGWIINKVDNERIHRFSDKNISYSVCDFIFNVAKRNEWVSWDQIAEYIEGEPGGKNDISIDWKRKIYDSIRLVNMYIEKKISRKIIDNDGKGRYKVME